MPTVVTHAVSNITSSGAFLSGNVTGDGDATATERGFVYSTSVNPTTSGGTKALAGNGTGGFTAGLPRLAANAAYHVRAYAINSQGTSYGGSRSFTTLANGSVSGPGPDGDDLPSALIVLYSMLRAIERCIRAMCCPAVERPLQNAASFTAKTVIRRYPPERG